MLSSTFRRVMVSSRFRRRVLMSSRFRRKVMLSIRFRRRVMVSSGLWGLRTFDKLGLHDV